MEHFIQDVIIKIFICSYNIIFIMGKIKAKLTDYKNFWLIWLSCAGSGNGISLFKIQTTWDIRTNYLYHREAGLGKPLFSLMAEEGYIEISFSCL